MPIQFAARKHGWRQTDKGYVLTLLIDPTDQWQEVALASLGEAFGVAMVKIDPATGQSVPEVHGGYSHIEAAPSGANTDNSRQRVSGKRWSEMSRAQQAGVLCADERFWRWAGVTNSDQAAEYLRHQCGVNSRRELDGKPEMFDAMIATYRRDTGQMAEARR